MTVPVVLITGAGRGLGRALALAYARVQYRVVVNFHQNEPAAQKTADDIRALGAESLVIRADVRNSVAVNALVSEVVAAWGRIDILINNATSVRNRTLAKMTDEEWREVMASNLDAAFYTTRAVIPVMRRQEGGSIINMGSIAGGRGLRGAANYAAAKAGLVALTKTTAIEEGSLGIRANVVLPGFHVTDLNRDVWDKAEAAIRAQHLLKEMPHRDAMADFVVSVANLPTVTGQVFAFESRIL